jgi:hypothetical protein
MYPVCIQNFSRKLDKIRMSFLNGDMPWKREKANGTIVCYTRFRHHGRKICVPTKAKTEGQCREIEQKMKRDVDLDVEKGDRRGRLLPKLSYECVQWLLTYRSQEHAEILSRVVDGGTADLASPSS